MHQGDRSGIIRIETEKMYAIVEKKDQPKKELTVGKLKLEERRQKLTTNLYRENSKESQFAYQLFQRSDWMKKQTIFEHQEDQR